MVAPVNCSNSPPSRFTAHFSAIGLSSDLSLKLKIQSLFRTSNLMFGEAASALTIVFNADYGGFLLAILPPGAFFGLAILIVVKNVIDERRPAPVVVSNAIPDNA